MIVHIISKSNPITNLPIGANHIIEETDDLLIVYIKD